MSRVGKSIETESIYSGCQGLGEKAGVEWSVIANEHRVSFWGGENVLELDNGDDCTAKKTENHWTAYFKGWILWYGNYSSIKWYCNIQLSPLCMLFPSLIDFLSSLLSPSYGPSFLQHQQFFLVVPWLQHLSFPKRDWTHATCNGSVVSIGPPGKSFKSILDKSLNSTLWQKDNPEWISFLQAYTCITKFYWRK